jgi:hypothetical protein
MRFLIGAMPLAVSLCISVYTGPDQKDTKKASPLRASNKLERDRCTDISSRSLLPCIMVRGNNLNFPVSGRMLGGMHCSQQRSQPAGFSGRTPQEKHYTKTPQESREGGHLQQYVKLIRRKFTQVGCSPGRHVLPEALGLPEALFSRKASSPGRFGLPEGLFSRKVCSPGRLVLPEGLVSRKVWSPGRLLRGHHQCTIWSPRSIRECGWTDGGEAMVSKVEMNVRFSREKGEQWASQIPGSVSRLVKHNRLCLETLSQTLVRRQVG